MHGAPAHVEQPVRHAPVGRGAQLAITVDARHGHEEDTRRHEDLGPPVDVDRRVHPEQREHAGVGLRRRPQAVHVQVFPPHGLGWLFLLKARHRHCLQIFRLQRILPPLVNELACVREPIVIGKKLTDVGQPDGRIGPLASLDG
jgi:hypothetical protein